MGETRAHCATEEEYDFAFRVYWTSLINSSQIIPLPPSPTSHLIHFSSHTRLLQSTGSGRIFHRGFSSARVERTRLDPYLHLATATPVGRSAIYRRTFMPSTNRFQGSTLASGVIRLTNQRRLPANATQTILMTYEVHAPFLSHHRSS